MTEPLSPVPFQTDASVRDSLPSWIYRDPAVFSAEQERIFARTWQYVGHVETLRQSGAYMVREVAGESLIVIRDKDGDIRAFFNVCSHRAMRLLKGEGCTRRIACPYHAWTYDTKGDLISAPNADNVAGFDPAGRGLKPCRVETMHGLVFVNLDPDAPALAVAAAGLEDEFKAYAPTLPDLTFVHRTEATVKANWKVSVENFSECYHCTLIHREFVNGVVDPNSYHVRVNGLWQKHLSRSRTGTTKAYDFDDSAAPHANEFGAWWLWPNFAFQSYPGGAVHVWKWTAVDPETTHVAVDWYFPSADLEGWQRDLIDHHAATTFAEDLPIVEDVQQGLASRAYDRGPLMIDGAGTVLSEHGVAAIQDLWLAAMEGCDDRL